MLTGLLIAFHWLKDKIWLVYKPRSVNPKVSQRSIIKSHLFQCIRLEITSKECKDEIFSVYSLLSDDV